MSEYRQDPISRHWVIIGTERAQRPCEYAEPVFERQSVACSFCAGNESQTPPAIATYAGPRDPGQWLVRVVPNKYPALAAANTTQGDAPFFSEVVCDRPLPGIGSHEVIVESPGHVASLSELTPIESELVFRAYRDRLRAHLASGQSEYVQIFKNVGPAAGASLEHSHSQLIALPGVPEVVARQLAIASEYYSKTGNALFAEWIDQELRRGDRVVAQTEQFVAFCPYASRFGYEVWVAPRQHRPRFEDAQDRELGELSALMQNLIGCLEKSAGMTAYNFYLYTSPASGGHESFQWHFQIVPRISKIAGFEWSTGCFINPYPPEACASVLRSAIKGR